MIETTSQGSAKARANSRLIQSVDRAIQLLSAVASEPGTLGVPDLAARVGLNRSTAWRLLATLEHHGLVHRDRGTQRFSVGYRILELAEAADYRALVTTARPVIEEYCQRTNESVTLCVPRHMSVRVIDQVDPPRTLRANWIGRDLPLHASSMGLVYLTSLSDAELERAIQLPLIAYTKRTTTDPTKLRTAVVRARRRGFAISVEDPEVGTFGVSAPVWNSGGRLIAIVNIWGGVRGLPRSRIMELGKIAGEAARALERRLAEAGLQF